MTESDSIHPGVRLLPRCPVCDYDLTGLPDEGRCPECGFEYDNSFMMRYGRPIAGRATWPNMIFAALLSFGLLLFMAEYFLLGPGLIVIAIAYGLWLRHSVMVAHRRPLQHQLLISRRGVSVRLGPGTTQYIDWPHITQCRMNRSRTPWFLWSKAHAYFWHITFVASRIPDSLKNANIPLKQLGKGHAFFGLLFSAEPAEAERIHAHLYALFDAGRVQ
jgi:hypothetical protein